MAKIAFCGLGMMGSPMAARLLEAGHDVTVWNRTPDKAGPLVERGASRAVSPLEAASGAEAAITMLADPNALEAVVFGDGGLAEGMANGTALIDMSTVGPDAVRRLRERLPGGITLIDAPVLGSIPGAESGELQVFAGGEAEVVERWRPVLEEMGTVHHAGPLGAGASMKLVANSTLGALIASLGEALALGDALGLEERLVLDVLAQSPLAVTVRRKRKLIESGSYPPSFKLSLAGKDLGLVAQAAKGVDLRVARASSSWLEAAEAAGLGDLDYSAVVANIRGRPATA
jgi:3-hydroxyisobutyrate dehydrogenase-like beta-hydroxyacid dehydrogenase